LFPIKVTVRRLRDAENFSRRQTPPVARNSLHNDKSNAVESNYVFKKLQMQDLDFTTVKSPSAKGTNDGSTCESLLSLDIRITALDWIVLDCVCNVTALAQKTDFIFQRNGRVHLNRSPLLAAEVSGSAGSDCIIFSKYVDNSLKMSLQDGKGGVKMSGECEIVYNVHKFMKTESEVGITIPLSKVQKRESLKQHV